MPTHHPINKSKPYNLTHAQKHINHVLPPTNIKPKYMHHAKLPTINEIINEAILLKKSL